MKLSEYECLKIAKSLEKYDDPPSRKRAKEYVEMFLEEWIPNLTAEEPESLEYMLKGFFQQALEENV